MDANANGTESTNGMEIDILSSTSNQISNVEIDVLGSTSNQNNDSEINNLGTNLNRNNTPEIVILGSTSDRSNDNSDQLFKAAANGNIEPFKNMAEQLHLILTPLKNTVLHINITSEKASTKFVKEILDICPSLLLQVNAQGDTSLHVAAKFERLDVARVLIEKAKRQQEEDLENGIGVTRRMLRMTNDKGNTALHEAVQHKRVYIVRILVKEDPDFSHPTNKGGETPLYIAAETGNFEGAVEILENSTSATHAGPNGKTALHAAIRSEAPGLPRKILEKMRSLTKKIDDNGWTPLHYAAYYGYLPVVRVLLEFDASATCMADKSREMTPLHLAASQGHTDVVKEIITSCPDCYELVDNRGWNVLHFAMASFSTKKLCNLLENPSIERLVYEKDAKGNTPLHVLATCARSEGSADLLVNIVHQVRNHGIGAVNRQNISVADAFMYRCPELEKEIMTLSEDTSNGVYPQGVIRLRGKRHDVYFLLVRGAKKSHLVAAALIATVTFGAAFTLPGGYKSEGMNQGSPVLSRNLAFQTFVMTDAIAMVCSISAVFIYFVMSVQRFRKYIYMFEVGSWLTVVAMAAMVIAFVTGTYAVLAHSFWLAIVTCFIGLSCFLFVLPMIYRFSPLIHHKWQLKIQKFERKIHKRLPHVGKLAT